MSGDQFTSGFCSVNPNSKIPSALDLEGPDGSPIELFESASIVLYLAEKHRRFLPSNLADKQRVLNWLFWQMAGQGPMTGNFGHFMVYAPDDKVEARNYGVMRYGMETQRLCSVLENHLATRQYMVGEEYSIADIAIFPWFQQLRTGLLERSHAAGF
jgi:GST-like protein